MDIKAKRRTIDREESKKGDLEGKELKEEILKVIGTEEFLGGKEMSEVESDENIDCTSKRNEEKSCPQSEVKEKDREHEEKIYSEDIGKGNKMSTEDEEEEEEVIPFRNKRRMRKRRVIYSVEGDEMESEDEIGDSSSHTENTAKRKASTPDNIPEGKKKKKDKTPPPLEIERMATRSSDPIVKDVGLDMLSAASLGVKINDWADELEEMRGKSKNLQGKVSGLMKVKIMRIKEAVISLVMKAEATGDPDFLRMRNRELVTELNAAEKEINSLKDNNKRLKQVKIEEKRNTEKIIVSPDLGCYLPQYEKGGNIRKPKGYIQERMRGTEGRETEEEEIIMRPPLKGIANPIPSQRDIDVQEQEISKQIEALIATRKEMRNIRKGKEGGQEEKDVGKTRRNLPKIIGNEMIAPPGNYEGRGEEFPPLKETCGVKWTTIVSKMKKKKEEADTNRKKEVEKKEVQRNIMRNRSKSPKSRVPRTAAIVISGSNVNFSYAEALRAARKEISLKDLEIENIKIRKTVSGGRLIEIAGPDGQTKADKLAEKLKHVLKEEAVVTRPVRKGEIRITGLDDSVGLEEVGAIIMENSKCSLADIKMGNIRRFSNGQGAIWVQCPLAEAIKLAELEKIRIGWSVVKIELLKARPTQCYRCWEFGHLSYMCKSQVNRKGSCFNCGVHGHTVQVCNNPTCCIICKEAGMPYDHRIGSPACCTMCKTKAMPERKETNERMEYDTVGTTEC